MILNTGHLAIRDRPDEVLGLFKETFLSGNLIDGLENNSSKFVIA